MAAASQGQRDPGPYRVPSSQALQPRPQALGAAQRAGPWQGQGPATRQEREVPRGRQTDPTMPGEARTFTANRRSVAVAVAGRRGPDPLNT
jgi:hypothetical protein